MTQKDKIGVVVIIGLFVVLGVILFITIDRPSGSPGSFENNVIIDQRVKNVNKSR